MAFSLDTSFFIQGWKHYPPDIFPGFWAKIAHHIEEGELVAITAVRDELARKDDDIFKWTRNHKKVYVDYNDAILAATSLLLERFPLIVEQRKKDKTDADAFVIALANTLNCPVVTEEGNKPHGIPAICKEIGIRPLTIVELMRELRLTF